MKHINSDWENFCFNIVWLRKQHNLSKKSMAKILGISISSLNKLERREIPPRLNIDFIFNLMDYFQISPHPLFAERFED